MLDFAPAQADPETDPTVVRSTLGFPVVGIGASAGGIAALQRVLEGMPAQIGMAFVVVVHLSPSHESALADILQRTTRMPVRQVTLTVSIECDHVYVISPSKQLVMTDGQLVGSDLVRTDGRQMSIDLFFRSLAEAHRERSVAMVLSGTGSDGTQGLKRIRELGGVTMAQSPEDAEYDGMPRSAIGAGLVDFVLPAVDIGQSLFSLWESASRIELPSPPDDLQATPSEPAAKGAAAEDALSEIRMLLRQRTGHDFTHYKRATVMRRIERRMQVRRVSNLIDYLQVLQDDTAEPGALLQDMLISVTNFFRDRPAFEALERELMAVPNKELSTPFRAWVAGCATGEEAYSIAMLLEEQIAAGPAKRTVQVFASDIDQRAILVGRTGLYPSSILTDVAPTRLRQYFSEEQGQFRIVKSVRENVVFSLHNALRDPPFSQLDLVCCRNLLIYLDRMAQAQLLKTFHFALNPGGLLFLGNSESADVAPELFTAVDKRQRIYRPSGPRTVVKALLSGGPDMTVTPSFHLQPPPSAAKPVPDLPYQQALLAHTPAVLINAEEQVLHVNAAAAPLLRMSVGRPTTALLALIHPELQVPLRSALFRANETRKSVRAAPVRIVQNGQEKFLSIDVLPIDDVAMGPCRLVLLASVDITLAGDATLLDPGHPTVTALQDELQRANRLLSGSMGESAHANEELRSMNEELRSMNEELRSATEELETGKEELQSLNEELITANHELKANIEETAKANDDLSNLVASMDIGTVFVDRALRIKRFTPRATMLFNLIPTDVGRPLLDITHRLRYPAFADDLSRMMTALCPSEREVISEDGGRHLVRLLPYRTREDRIDGAVINVIDVSALRSAEEQVRRHEQRMRMVADSMGDFAIITFDAEGKITSWNAGAVTMFGHTAEEVLGKRADFIFTPEDRADKVFDKELGRAREAGRAEDERWHVRKNGQRFYASGIMSPIVDHGQLLGYAKIARDLTQSKLQEAQRDASLDAAKAVREKLEEASRMKDEFLAVMSHELKNPLNLIQMNAEMLLRIPQASALPMVARAAHIIRQSVASQAQIIDDLLDLSRLNTGKFGLNVGPVPLRPIVQRIVGAARAGSRAKLQTISEDVPDVVVHADPVRVEQILWNLVSNAQKFTPDGGAIDISAAVDGDQVVLNVVDTGEGMEEPFLSQVFEMFRQADSGISRQRGGLGIGLALVRRLAELHGGTATASSKGRSRGSTFCVSLPLHSGDPHDTLPPPMSDTCAGMRVLLVEDDPDALDMFTQLLSMEGALVAAAGNGGDALERATAEPFDVVVSDLSMPGMDGYTMASRMRALPQHAQTVLVALSGMARPGDRKRALDAGFDAHFAKPVEVDRLLETVRQLVAQRPKGSSPPAGRQLAGGSG